MTIKHIAQRKAILKPSKHSTLWPRDHIKNASNHMELCSGRMKNATSLKAFKVKELAIDKCPCKIHKQYIQGVSYLD